MADLPDLLEEIDEGRVAIPDFQRDFDWTKSDVLKLLVTVLKGWPAGSLLLMHGRAKFYEVRPIEGGPEPRPNRLSFTILDGQQRLTALYQAIYDRGPFVYSVKAQALESGDVDSLEDGVEAHDRLHWDATFRNRTWAQNDFRVPFYVLRSASHYFEWRDSVIAEADPADRDAVAARLSALYRDALEAFDRYKFPAVTVEAELEPAAISRIFERVNKTGMPLSSFDLMVARVYEPGWNLRAHWDRARLEGDLIDAFLGEDGLPVLQVLALKERANVRDAAVLDLPQGTVRNRWEASVDATDTALRFLFQQCGVLRREWLPYKGFLLPLAALALDFDLEAARDELVAWFWSRSFSLAYDAAVNTRIVADYAVLTKVLRGEAELEIPPASASVLLGASRRAQAPIWRAFLCALASLDAQDLTGADLGIVAARRDLNPLPNDVVVTSVFSRNLDYPQREEPPHLRVLGMMLATRETARRLPNEYLADVLDEVESEDGEESVERALASQLLPDVRADDLNEDDWERFLSERLKNLERFLAENAGQTIERSED